MLLTYHEFNPGLGYVQGMSDLLAPIYAVMQDDAVAFWGFVGFMERMVRSIHYCICPLSTVTDKIQERNFLRDQSGMRAQLMTLDHLVQLMDPQLYLHLQSADSTNFFFFFRMLLVWYKREFAWADILRLWETLWTDYLSSSFHLFIALAILEKHRDVIMDHLKHFDEVLKYSKFSALWTGELLADSFQSTSCLTRWSWFPSSPERNPCSDDLSGLYRRWIRKITFQHHQRLVAESQVPATVRGQIKASQLNVRLAVAATSASVWAQRTRRKSFLLNSDNCLVAK